MIDPDTYEPLWEPLERLFRAYDAPVRAHLHHRFPHAQDRADDAMAFAWMQAARHVHTISFHTADRWLWTVAKHELYAIFARERRERPIEDDKIEYLLRDEGPIDRLIDQLDARDEAEDALAGLIPNQRRALLGRALGLSYRQLAEATGTSFTHVNRHLTEGRARAWRTRLTAQQIQPVEIEVG